MNLFVLLQRVVSVKADRKLTTTDSWLIKVMVVLKR